MRASEFSTEKLREQIGKGRIWLQDHSQQFGQDIAENGEPYNDEVFQQKRLAYESLVDEFRRRGYDEPIILSDADLIQNEKKIRTNIYNLPEGYNKAYTRWFKLRDELVNRKLVPFFIPTSKEW